MKSKATTVEKYLAEVPEEQRPALETLRELCLDELTGYEEEMQYGMPSYSRDGSAMEVAFASQKNYISLYVLRESVIEANTYLLDGLSVGKGCIRFKRPEQVDPAIVRPCCPVLPPIPVRSASAKVEHILQVGDPIEHQIQDVRTQDQGVDQQ